MAAKVHSDARGARRQTFLDSRASFAKPRHRRHSRQRCRFSMATPRQPGIVEPRDSAEYIDRHPAELLRRLQQLVGFATINPPGELYDAQTAWLRTEMDAVGLHA